MDTLDSAAGELPRGSRHFFDLTITGSFFAGHAQAWAL
jgi:hypothetical protein